MQDEPSFTRGGKRFRGNIEDIEQPWVRHREDALDRFSEGLRETFSLLLDSSTQTTSPPEQNTSAGSSQGGRVRAPQSPGRGQANPPSAHPQQTNSSSAQKSPPLHKTKMGDNIKLPIFRGPVVEDPNQHFFLCEAVWNIKYRAMTLKGCS